MILFENIGYWLRNKVAPAPVRLLEHGDVVLPADIERVYSERLAEDGRVIRLYDTRCRRTGAQAFPLGANPRDRVAYPIKICD